MPLPETLFIGLGMNVAKMPISRATVRMIHLASVTSSAVFSIDVNSSSISSWPAATS